MGKAKKRNFQNCVNAKNSLLKTMSRKSAVKEVVKRVKDNDFGSETKDLITLFGISAEELSECGAVYEELKALKSLFI